MDFKRHWVHVPDNLVIRVPRRRIFGFPLDLRTDVAAWCKANKMRPVVAPVVVVIADHYHAPFMVSIRGEKKAALFKLFWC